MADLGPVGKADDKKSSIIAKMGGMISAARRDGQKPKRWIWSSEFLLKVSVYLIDDLDDTNDPRISTALLVFPERVVFFGLSITVDPNALHDCELEVE